MLDVYEAKPLLKLGGPTYGWLRAAFHSMRRARPRHYLKRITTPSLLVSASADTVVNTDTHERAANAMADCTFLKIHDAKHEILHETDEIRTCFFRAFDRHILKEKRY
jgi:lysophospholipase